MKHSAHCSPPAISSLRASGRRPGGGSGGGAGRVRRAGLAALAAGIVVAGTVVLPPGGGAQEQRLARFDLTARADSVGIETISTGLPLVPEGRAAFLTPASAQAQLSSFGSFGNSEAFASAPYPGEFLVSLPNTANGLGTGTIPPFPSYPFYVSADTSRPERHEEFGPYRISAQAENAAARAESRLGLSTTPPQIASIISRATVGQEPGTEKLRSEAVAEIAPFSVGNLLRIADVRSTAVLTFDPAKPAQKVVKSTAFSVGSITVANTEVGLTKDGLTVAGNQLAPVDAGALEDMLEAAGITIEYLPGTETDTSITSAALQITLKGNAPVFRESTLRYVLGQVSVTAAPVLAPPIDTGSVFDPTAPFPTDAPPLLDLPAFDTAPPVGLDLTFPTDVEFGPADQSSLPAALGTGAARPPRPAVILPGTPAATRTIPPLTDPSPYYLLVAVALLAAVLAGRLTARRAGS